MKGKKRREALCTVRPRRISRETPDDVTEFGKQSRQCLQRIYWPQAEGQTPSHPGPRRVRSAR